MRGMTSTAAQAAPQVRVRDTRDLLSVIPYALGFRPAECLLVVCIRPGGRLGLVARTDLADLRTTRARAELAELVTTRAAQDRTVSAYVVLYTAHDVAPGSPERAAADAFALALDSVVADRESWVVGPHRYRSLDCTDPSCCPPDGFPVEGLESTAPGAQLVLEGCAPAGTREDLYRISRAPQAQRALVRRAAARWSAAGERSAAEGDAAARAWRAGSFAAWLDLADGAASGRAPAPALLGRVAVALEDRRVRDGVLLWCVGWDEHATAVAAGDGVDAEGDAATAEAMATVVDPRTGRRPDEARTRATVAALETVVAHAATARTASPLTLLGFLAWWSGEGARAGFRVAEALAVDPSHRLANLLAAALGAALPPGWVHGRDDAEPWRGVGRDLG